MSVPHILILSANTGGGHNSTAAAVREEMTRRGVTRCDVRDCLAYISEVASEFISWGHSYVYKNLPNLFGRAYRYEENRPPQFLYETISLGAERFYRAVKDEGYDAILCVHVFAGILVTEAHRRFGYDVPFYFMATDYTCSPGVPSIEAAAAFIPAEDLRLEFTDCGVDPARIVVSGIPIRRGFYDLPAKAEARTRLGIPADGTVVLLSCGSMGCGRINHIAPQLRRTLPERVTLIILCGNNRRVYRQLGRKEMPNTVVVDFTREVPLYMAASDLCISKPGGLTTTEMAAAHLPMVLMLAVPGCESRNFDFMKKRRFAVGADDWDEVICLAAELANDPARLQAMAQRMAEDPFPHGAAVTAEHILSHWERDRAAAEADSAARAEAPAQTRAALRAELRAKDGSATARRG